MKTPKTYVAEHGFDRSSSMYKNFKYLFVNPFWEKKVPKGFSVCPFFWLSLLGALFRIISPIILGFCAICRFLAMIGGVYSRKITHKLNGWFKLNWRPDQYVCCCALSLVGLLITSLFLSLIVMITIKAHEKPEYMAIYYSSIYFVTGLIASVMYEIKLAKSTCRPLISFFLGGLIILVSYNFIFEWQIPTMLAEIVANGYSHMIEFLGWLFHKIWIILVASPAFILYFAKILLIITGIFAITGVLGYILFKSINIDINYESRYKERLGEELSKYHSIQADIILDIYTWRGKKEMFEAFAYYLTKNDIKNNRTKYPNSRRITELLNVAWVDYYDIQEKITAFKSTPEYAAIVANDLRYHAEQMAELELRRKLRESPTTETNNHVMIKLCNKFWGKIGLFGAIIRMGCAKISLWLSKNVFSWFSALWQSIKHFKKGFCPYVTFKGEE